MLLVKKNLQVRVKCFPKVFILHFIEETLRFLGTIIMADIGRPSEHKTVSEKLVKVSSACVIQVSLG